MAEEIIGAVGQTTLGSFRAKSYFLFFTPSRVIAARGGGTFGSNFARYSGSMIGGLISALKEKEIGEELAQLSPDEILVGDKDNFEIPYGDITKVEVKNPGFLSSVGSVIIHTGKKKYQFNETSSKEIFDRYRELVKTVLADKYSGE